MDQELDTPAAGRNDNGPEEDNGGMIVRNFAAEMTSGEGRTVDVRIVPYGERVVHNDGLGGVPKGIPYSEEWMPGAFANQENAANRVLVNFEHQKGIGGVIGHGLMLREAADGFYGSFKLHETPDGEKALMLVREGALGGVSLEAVSKKSIRMANGVVRRVKAHLHGIALTRKGAYSGSVVLALREEAQIFDEEMLPVEIDPELIARCERLGIALPERMKAQPAETDTPALTGTSEDGTRQAQ